MTASADPDIYQLIYRSRSALTGSDAAIESEIGAILDKSVRNNSRHDVTGALMFTASVFVQVLEGRCADVERTFERICCDLRHMGVELMSFSPVPARVFGNWHLHRVDADSTIEALFRHLSNTAEPESRSAADATSKAVALMAGLANKAVAAAER